MCAACSVCFLKHETAQILTTCKLLQAIKIQSEPGVFVYFYTVPTTESVHKDRLQCNASWGFHALKGCKPIHFREFIVAQVKVYGYKTPVLSMNNLFSLCQLKHLIIAISRVTVLHTTLLVRHTFVLLL